MEILPRTTATIPSVNFDRSSSYDRIIGFHDLIETIAQSDQKRDVRIPAPFAGIGLIRGISQEGSIVMPRSMGIKGKLAYGHKVSYNEPMLTYDIQKYDEQVFQPKRIRGFMDFSATQGYREDPRVTTMETYMVINSFIRYFRQIALNLFIRDISTVKQKVGNYIYKVHSGPTEVNFNVALDTPADELDLSAVTPTADTADVYAAVSLVCEKLFGEYAFRGEFPVVLVPSKVWYKMSDSLRRELDGLLIRDEMTDVFLSNTLDRKLSLYNVFFFNNVYFIGVPEQIVRDFSVGFEDIVGVDGFPTDYATTFPTNKGVAFFPSGVVMSEQFYELIVGVNRAQGVSLSQGVAVNSNSFASGQYNLDSTIRMLMLDTVYTSRIYSDFAQRNLVSISGNPVRAYTQLECSVRDDNEDIVNSMRTKLVTFSCNDIIKPRAVNTIKLPPVSRF